MKRKANEAVTRQLELEQQLEGRIQEREPALEYLRTLAADPD